MPVTHTLISPLPDNAADAAAGLVVSSDWNADHAVDSIVIATGTITASEPAVDITQTWNNAAVTFTAQKVNVTDTASASGSLLADWQVGGTSKASIRKDGVLSLGGASAGACTFKWSSADQLLISSNSAYQRVLAYSFWHNNLAAGVGDNGVIGGISVSLASSTGLGWTSAGNINAGTYDVMLYRDAAATLAQRNGTNAQTLRVYGTYTDGSNYVRASLASSSTAVTLAAETAGTGADNVPVNLTPAGTEGVVIGNFAQFTEMTAPAAGAANTARLFCEDNGAGKTRLMVQFASGAAQQIAIEP